MASKIEVTLFDYDEIDDIVWEAILETSQDMLKELKRDPKTPHNTGEYKRSLDVKRRKKDLTAVLFENKNKKDVKGKRLIGHLLEHGVMDYGGMEAQPHWDPLEEKYAPIIRDEMVKKINERY